MTSRLWLATNACGEYRLTVFGDLRLVVLRDAVFAARLVPLFVRFVDAIFLLVERLKGVRFRLRFATVASGMSYLLAGLILRACRACPAW